MATRTLDQPVLSRAAMNLLLLAIRPASATDHLIIAPKLGLFGPSEIVLTPDTTKAALDAIEVVFTGYTAGGAAVTFQTTTVRTGLGKQCTLSTNNVWVVGTADPLVTAEVSGWYLYDTTYGLICSEKFGTAVSMANTGDFLDLFAGLPIRLAA